MVCLQIGQHSKRSKKREEKSLSVLKVCNTGCRRHALDLGSEHQLFRTPTRNVGLSWSSRFLDGTWLKLSYW